jgi:TPP-dependent pyruvate/acetoin dehydrogenase alpha subunit
MLEKGWAGRDQLDQTYTRIRREVDEAIKWAESCPYPDPSELLEGVYGQSGGE